MKTTSYETGYKLETQVKQLLIQQGFTAKRNIDASNLMKKEFIAQAIVQGKFCTWKPDFVIRTEDGRLLILEAKNPDPKQPVNVGISVREIIAMFFDIGLAGNQFSFIAVTGDSVNVDKSHKGFKRLLEEGLHIKHITISELDRKGANII